ncbi:MAG: hypothetical protein HFF44_08005 [Lawsonibacter sp.]|nr:hypothetical protein [Lawsonibacter sp.]
MKIYHKKNFYLALALFGVAIFFLIQSEKHQWEGGSLFQAAIAALGGLNALYTALSQKAARRELIKEQDEMLILENLKCYRAAYWTTIVLLLLISLMFSRSTDTFTQCLSLTAFLTCFLMIVVHSLISIMAGSHNAQ